MDKQETISHGVQELIDKLKEDGVSAGRETANQIEEEARKKAKEILSVAQKEADDILYSAREQANLEKDSAREAFQLAFRDASLKLKEMISEEFAARLQRLVKQELDDTAFLRQLILLLTTEEKYDEFKKQNVDVILPESIFELEDLREDPVEARDSQLSQFVHSLVSNQLRTGVELHIGRDHSSGLKIQLNGNSIELDFTDQAITDMLLNHLMPRFRAMLDGIS
jgi:V/A-type H+-transporting ATPase subunit E